MRGSCKGGDCREVEEVFGVFFFGRLFFVVLLKENPCFKVFKAWFHDRGLPKERPKTKKTPFSTKYFKFFVFFFHFFLFFSCFIFFSSFVSPFFPPFFLFYFFLASVAA